jgi:hypothetical protein
MAKTPWQLHCVFANGVACLTFVCAGGDGLLSRKGSLLHLADVTSTVLASVSKGLFCCLQAVMVRCFDGARC